jgi:integrase
VRGAVWEEIDLGSRTWTISAERMKGGREHRVPLCARAITILNDMWKIRQSDYVFPSSKQERPLSDMALLMLLRDVRPGVTVHGFRSTFKDWASESTSFPDHLSEAALAHASADKVRAAYARSDLFLRRRKLLDAWAAYGARAVSAGVIELRARDQRSR